MKGSLCFLLALFILAIVSGPCNAKLAWSGWAASDSAVEDQSKDSSYVTMAERRLLASTAVAPAPSAAAPAPATTKRLLRRMLISSAAPAPAPGPVPAVKSIYGRRRILRSYGAPAPAPGPY